MREPSKRIIYIQPDAPSKPAVGAPCNGCGLCCLAEPCPLGMWVSRRRTGTCIALRWNEESRRYLCGMVAEPGEVLGWRSPWAVRWVQRLAHRWIASGIGCDADLEVQASSPASTDLRR